MDNPVMEGGLIQGSMTGMLDLEPSIHRHHSSQQAMIPHFQNNQNQQQQTHHLHPAMSLSNDHPISAQTHYWGKLLSSSASDDDDDHEPSFLNDDTGIPRDRKGATGGGSSSSAWHRMKWTDEIVRLLITVVASVGDDGVADSFDGSTGTKRKAGGGDCRVLQKKGKWKTVSQLMCERGCSVTPQQCEDKFNDLNKRYKRLNEILGRGTTCQVVENPSLLDSMANVSPKGKDDVRKILSSKHLFYREMCVYHNGQRIPNSNEIKSHGCGVSFSPIAVGPLKDSEIDVAEEDGDSEGENLEIRKMGTDSFQLEMDEAFQKGNKTSSEQRDWFWKRALQLHEERVGIQAETFELEKKRFKWQRFCSKKDREIEMMWLENERMALEIDQMMMQVKQKEMELIPEKSEDLGAFTGFKFDVDQLRNECEILL